MKHWRKKIVENNMKWEKQKYKSWKSLLLLQNFCPRCPYVILIKFQNTLPVTQLLSSAVILLKWRRWSLIYAKKRPLVANSMSNDSIAPRDGRDVGAERRKLEKEPREESRRVLTPVAKSKRVLSCNIVSLTAAREALEKAYLPPPPPPAATPPPHLHSTQDRSPGPHSSCWTLRNFWIVPEKLVVFAGSLNSCYVLTAR